MTELVQGGKCDRDGGEEKDLGPEPRCCRCKDVGCMQDGAAVDRVTRSVHLHPALTQEGC